MPLDTGAACCSNMVVLYSLGWLFEVNRSVFLNTLIVIDTCTSFCAWQTPNITEHVFFDYMKDMPGLLDLTSSLTQNKLVC